MTSTKRRSRTGTAERAAEIADVDVDLVYSVARAIGNAEGWALQWGVAMDQTAEGFYTGMAAYDLVGITGMFDHPGGMVAGIVPFNIGFPWIPSMEEVNWIPPGPSHAPACFEAGTSRVSTPWACRALSSPSSKAWKATRVRTDYTIKSVIFFATNPLANEGAQPKRTYEAIIKGNRVQCRAGYLDDTHGPGLRRRLLARGDVRRAKRHLRLASPIVPAQSSKAVEPAGEARSDQSILIELGKRFCG